MKNSLFISLILVTQVYYSCPGQVEINAGYLSSSYTGSKLSLGVGYTFGKSAVSGSILYLMNSRVHDLDPDHFFKRRFYANLPTQHLGGSIGYLYRCLSTEYLDLFATYDFVFTRADLKSDRYIPTEEVDGIQFYRYVDETSPVTIGIENVLSLKLNLPLFGPFYITQSLGAGIVSFHSVPDTIQSQLSKNYDLTTMIRIGLAARL